MKDLMAKIAKAGAKSRELLQKRAEKTAEFFRSGHWGEMPLLRKILVAVGLALVLIYPVSAFITHKIDDDLGFRTEKQATTLVVTDIAALIDREVRGNGWIANKPVFFPQALILDNMPNYQRGIIHGLHGAVRALTKASGRAEFQEAANALGTPGDQWSFGRKNAARQYMMAASLLQEGSVEISMNHDLFMGLVDEAAHAIQNRFRETAAFIENGVIFKTDNEFYFNRGMLYALYIVLRDAFAEIREYEENNYMEVRMGALLAVLEKAVEYDPPVIFAFSTTPSLLPNHLLVQNYYLAEIGVIAEDILNRR